MSPALRYLHAKFPHVAAWQVSASGARGDQTPEGIRVAPAVTMLKTLV